MIEKHKCLCQECNWHGFESDILTAPNPFEDCSEVNGCPECKSIDSIVTVCDEPGCWRQVSCGTPTNDGYRSTCGQHRPRINEHRQDTERKKE